MIIISDDDEQHASAIQALRVINSLRLRPGTIKPTTDDTHWTKTVWANPEYL